MVDFLKNASLAGASEALRFFGIKTSSFLVREAATVDQLHQGYRRLAPVRLDLRDKGLPPHSVPTLDNKTKEYWLAKGKLDRKDPEMEQRFKDLVRHASPHNINFKGQIVVPREPGGSYASLRRLLPDDQLPVLSGAGQRAVNIVTGLHEGFERGVKANEVAPVFSHLSPKVLLNEHNMLSRLTGPGADEARNFYSKLREIHPAETSAWQGRMVKEYGPAVAKFFEPGARIPAALKRDFVRKMRAQSIQIAPDDVASRSSFQKRMKTPTEIAALNAPL